MLWKFFIVAGFICLLVSIPLSKKCDTPLWVVFFAAWPILGLLVGVLLSNEEEVASKTQTMPPQCWEPVNFDSYGELSRYPVAQGWIYMVSDKQNISLTFVPEVHK